MNVPGAVRRLVKPLAEQVALLTPVPMLRRRQLRDQLLVLAYHNVVPDDLPVSGDRSLHIRAGDFARQLDHLAESYSVVPVSQPGAPGLHAKPRVAITFDDAYRGALTLGAEALASRLMPSTMFVAPGLLGDVAMWWDAVRDADGGDPPARFRVDALELCAGETARVLDLARARNLNIDDPPPIMRIGTSTELEEAARSGLMALGSHTWSHPNLARLDAGRVQSELQRSRDWLARTFPSSLPWLAYPYGEYSPDVQRAATAAGYEMGFAIRGGWTRLPVSDEMAHPRLNIPAGISLARFKLLIADVWRKRGD